jgi:LCP family protein required for cell wall assembly
MSKRLIKREYKILAVLKHGWERYTEWWEERHLAVKIALIAALSLTALVLSVLVVLSLWVRPPAPVDVILNPRPSPPEIELPPGYSPPPADPDAGEETQDGFFVREGVYTFLLGGINEGMTDTLMVATLDTVRRTCHVLSIPRDTVVERAPRTVKKINSAYGQRRSTWDDEPGIPQLKKEVATLIGFQPQYTAIVDYNAFLRLVAAIDGVDFNVPMRMYVPSEGIDLQAGWQHLNADRALQLVRFRYNHSTGVGYDDYGRMAMQQQFLLAAAQKALSQWTKVPEYIDIAQKNIESDNIDWGNLIWFAMEIREIGAENVELSTLPTVTVRRPAEILGDYYEAVLAEEALELINRTINPFNNPIGEDLVEYIKLTERRG